MLYRKCIERVYGSPIFSWYFQSTNGLAERAGALGDTMRWYIHKKHSHYFQHFHDCRDRKVRAAFLSMQFHLQSLCNVVWCGCNAFGHKFYWMLPSFMRGFAYWCLLWTILFSSFFLWKHGNKIKVHVTRGENEIDRSEEIEEIMVLESGEVFDEILFVSRCSHFRTYQNRIVIFLVENR